MPTYLVLGNFTEQGINNIKDTRKRADAFRETCEKAGATVKEMLWCLGKYDIALVLDAPDDETVTALTLSVSSHGNVRTETLRTFTSEEMGQILAKMA